MQLIQYTDWQRIFPSQWQRIANRKVNEACQEIEAIYQVDFDISHVFDKEGYSLFFKDLSYDNEKQVISAGTHFLPVSKTEEGYLLGETLIHNLDEFINNFYEQTGSLPEWKEKVWQSLDKLKALISNTEREKAY